MKNCDSLTKDRKCIDGFPTNAACIGRLNRGRLLPICCNEVVCARLYPNTGAPYKTSYIIGGYMDKKRQITKEDVISAIKAAEEVAYRYACELDIGEEREMAFLVYENIRMSMKIN